MFRNLKLASLCSPAAFGVKCLQQGQISATTTASTPTSTQPATTQLIQPVVTAQGAVAPSSPSHYSSSVPRSAVSANSVFQKHVSSSSTSLGGGQNQKQFSSVLHQQPFQQSRHVSTKGPSNTTLSDVAFPDFLQHHTAFEDSSEGKSQGGVSEKESDGGKMKKSSSDQWDPKPIVLIDRSGSTSMPFVNDSNFCILQQERQIVKDVLQGRGVANCTVMYWDHEVTTPISFMPEDVPEDDTRCGGTTYLGPALKKTLQVLEKEKAAQQTSDQTKSSSSSKKPPRDIYILTDGEIFDPKEIVQPMRALIGEYDVNLYLITVERSTRNYLTDDCFAGNTLLKALSENQWMACMRTVTQYNAHHLHGFTSFTNYRVPDGYIPFDEHCFLPKDLPQFFNFARELVDTTVAKFSSATGEGSSGSSSEVLEAQLLQLSHRLTRTCFYLSKGYVPGAANLIAKKFVNLFHNCPGHIYRQVSASFTQEISNHVHGRSTTFQSYRKTRETRFQQSQMNLFENALSAVTSPQPIGEEEKKLLLVTLPIGGLIVTSAATAKSLAAGGGGGASSSLNSASSLPNGTLCDIHLGGECFTSGGVSYEGYTLPAFTYDTSALADVYSPRAEDDAPAQNLRQWIRSNYSVLYELPVTSPMILAQLFLDTLRVVQSQNVSPPEVRDAYRFATTTLLSALWRGSETKTYRGHFIEGQRNVQLDRYLTKEAKRLGVNSRDLWFSCLKAYGDEELLKAQESVFTKRVGAEEGHTDDAALDVNEEDDAEGDTTVASRPPSTSGEIIPNEYLPSFPKEPAFAHRPCFTFKLYKTAPHDVLPGVECPATESSTADRCSMCGTTVETSMLAVSTDNKAAAGDKGNNVWPFGPNPLFARDAVKKISLEVESHSQPLMSLDKVEWSEGPFQISSPIVRDPLNRASCKIRSVEKFKSEVERRYPFMKDVDLGDGCALMGGFVRGILLQAKPKDFDFFFYGLEDPYARMTRLLEQLLPAVQKSFAERTAQKAIESAAKKLQGKSNVTSDDNVTKKDKVAALAATEPKSKFLYMYKPMFNVFEVIHCADPTDHFNEKFLYDNFKSYTFKTMKFFGHKSDKVQKDDFYFEDNDDKGIRILNRFQFVMGTFKSLEELTSGTDFGPASGVYTGTDVLLPPACVTSYKYMVNVMNPQGTVNEQFDHRVSKYLTYGFDIAFPFPGGVEELRKHLPVKALPEKDFKGTPTGSVASPTVGGASSASSPSSDATLTLGTLTFQVAKMAPSRIYVEHNSQRAQLLENAEELEAKQQSEGSVALYKSTLFPTLAGMMRYMCIHRINYLFSSEAVLPDKKTGMFPFTKSCLPSKEGSDALGKEIQGEPDYFPRRGSNKGTVNFRKKFYDLLKKYHAEINKRSKEQAGVSGDNGVSRGPCKLQFKPMTKLEEVPHRWFHQPTEGGLDAASKESKKD